MALHESALEELGLAPLWVRRGSEPVLAETGGDAASHVEALTAPQQQLAGAASVHQRLATQGPESTSMPAAERVSREVMTAAPAAQEDEAGDFAWFDDLPTTRPTAAPRAGADAVSGPGSASLSTPTPMPLAAPSPLTAPSSVAMLDWDALSQRVAHCEDCRLCEKRRNTVFGVGDRHADWMLVGEAPGENEDRLGEPFVGQAGKLLDSMLQALALERQSNVYIANVIKCRPPGNRNPEPDEVARCEPYLQRQVALVQPKLIVAFGRFAAQTLLRSTASIASLRGRVHEYEGVPVIVTYHPAYLLRSLPDKARAWQDLCLARATWRDALTEASV
ncbi:uracil-DNA glycosylase family protein [Paraburkholderia bonniea]|uniref:uracil-DNA glycosylase n=1 Tax=Paraburkholderia bonniea TaxID=2152891 RepID=UPI0012923779|nr:uracil-DNA glycosylase [Paraburkholderia bonniea]WJF89232.1 uracil-DNA glycosylase family protein [Paraburkholderia bonniea]WJF92548.1 uracil-DNA glycosylase family protein [Paraburkholderia bonniea]